MLARLLIAAVRLYQWTLSPLLVALFGRQCRFEPSCSSYAIDALRHHGPWRGTRLALHRLARCHPFTKGGYDPVTPREEVKRPASSILRP